MPLFSQVYPNAGRFDPRAHILVCINNPEHQTYQKKDTGTKMLSHTDGSLREVDVLTQRETTELAPITDQATALATVQRANALELFPTKNSSPDQLALLAQVALAYRLDPLMGELIPYQGKPYITIKGRRRLDDHAGNVVGIAHRPPTDEEERYFKKVGALHGQDVIQVCVGTLADGRVVEGFGRVLWSEDVAVTSPGGRSSLPIIMRKIEMAQVRSERRMREMAFGPVAKPAGLAVNVLEEGDESNVVEGTARVVDDEVSAKILDQGDLGLCPEHQEPWQVREDNYKKIQASHPLEGGQWCRFAKVYGEQFPKAYEARFGAYKKGEADAWLKDNFNGKTWSVMEPVQMLRAMTLVTTLPDAPTKDAPAEPGPAPTRPPPFDPDAPETAPDATEGIITEEQVGALLRLAGSEVSPFELAEKIHEIAGVYSPGAIPVGAYDEIIAWVNGQIDQRIAAVGH